MKKLFYATLIILLAVGLLLMVGSGVWNESQRDKFPTDADPAKGRIHRVNAHGFGKYSSRRHLYVTSEEAVPFQRSAKIFWVGAGCWVLAWMLAIALGKRIDKQSVSPETNEQIDN